MFRHADSQKYFPFSETLLRNLRSDWRELIKEVSSDEEASSAAFEVLWKAYTEENCYYHNLSHVNSLLLLAEEFQVKFSDYTSVRLAIWFHDAIYDPRRRDNEIESARLAANSLAKLGLAENKIQKVKTMILATENHNEESLDSDGKLFLDLDLSILGAASKITYRRYSAAIRREYAHVSDFLYTRGGVRLWRIFCGANLFILLTRCALDLSGRRGLI